MNCLIHDFLIKIKNKKSLKMLRTKLKKGKLLKKKIKKLLIN